MNKLPIHSFIQIIYFTLPWSSKVQVLLFLKNENTQISAIYELAVDWGRQ